ncbi:unnamed protein product [Gongylonema pulchrum]|uniref:Transmembrane protein 98 n=1 Tax=Gongylonema pulchrum TaxID=637853 RepID=A0A183E4F0_9BILA|nr:unnamed protein product [Gongylonema pulchrum]
MEIVYLALFVLAAVFFFSLFILIAMCRRRALTTKRFAEATSLRFTKVDNENVESVVQLEPLIAQVLDSNQWIYDVSGMLQHCVVILKLCHALTMKLSTIQLNSVDIRLLEARASSLVSTCWMLAFPFTVISPKHLNALDRLLYHLEQNATAAAAAAGKSNIPDGKPLLEPLATVIEETSLMESSTDRNDSTTESQHSDEAPADPGAPVTPS